MAVSETWYSEIESAVFTQVEYMLTQTYTTLNCTSKNQDISDIATFPTLYLHELEAVELGMDLTNDAVNAVLSTIEIMVWTNTTLYDCKAILGAAVTVMKSMGYNITMMPTALYDGDVASGVARFRRVVGANDADLITQ